MGCDVCQALVKQIEALLLDGKTEAEIASWVSQQCTVFSEPLASVCGKIATTYVPIIMQLIEKKMEKMEICKIIGFCEGNEIVSNNIKCDVCLKVVNYVEELLLSKLVEKEVAKLVSTLCLKIPTPGSSVCTYIVNKYIPVVMQWLEKGLEKAAICDKLGFCPSVPHLPKNANGLGCTVCKEVVAHIEKAMVDTKVEEEIEAIVGKLCVKFPAPYSTLCQSLVKQYIPIIMQWLEEGLEHADVCAKLGFCETTQSTRLARIPINEAENGITCDVCQSFFKWAEGELEHYTVAYLWKLVHEKCPNVHYIREFCKIINEENIETFVNLLLSKAPPKKVCEWIRIC